VRKPGEANGPKKGCFIRANTKEENVLKHRKYK
jgi:hypothetical protein